MIRTLLAYLCLTAVLAAAPVVTNTTPAPSGSVSSLTSISITFSESVAGLDANDLLINNEGATSVTGSGGGPYVFSFTQPPPGLVSVSWDFDHGIAGIGTGAFVPGTGWTYTLIDTLAPTIAKIKTSVNGQELDAIVPTPNSVVGTLTQVSVTFSETVTGVDAADLLVGGVPATAVTGTDAGPYVFSVPQPPAGVVALQWAASHGIKDGANNDFSGGAWSVTRSATGAGNIVINELLVANASIAPADEDGDFSDWIEIYNPGASAVNLLGWSLTTSASEPEQWVFPSRSVAAGGYLVVYTSGKDRKPASGNLHTNFTLNANGDSVYLFPPDCPRATAASSFADFPPQRYNYSYGPQPGGALRYFATPTPGAANGISGLTTIAPKPTASVSRGYFKDPFNVILSCSAATATIRYTLDGSVPLATSTAYTAPLSISNTTVLRAAAFSSVSVPSDTVTHSYIFLDSVLDQPSPPYDNPNISGDEANAALPTLSNIPVANGGVRQPISWGSNANFTSSNVNAAVYASLGSVTGTIPADYGMDPEIINDANKYDDTGAINNATGKLNIDRVKQGLRDLPLMSIVMKNDDIFGPSGLYPNSTVKGTSYEKPCSVELLMPDGNTAFATTCGLRVHGNASRNPDSTPKHGFKLNFKGSFGASSLGYALFPDSPVDEFDDIILRADYNSSWLHSDGGSTYGTFNGATVTGGQRGRGTRIRDAFCKETFRAMGNPAGHNRYVHLFINGLYWGVYDPTEQENNGFAAAYFGGKKDDYDVYEQGALKSGTSTAYNAMVAIASPIDNTKYEQMKGYLDIPFFVDYMLLHFWVGHQDWGDNIAKNWYAVRNRVTNGTFKYLPWDMENLMWDVTVDRTGVSFPASGLHPKLVTNAQYQLDFADRVQKHVVAVDGALQSAACIERWNKWKQLINSAIACESARWGDYRRDVHSFNGAVTYQLYAWNNQWALENSRLTSSLTNAWFANRNTNLTNGAQGLLPQLRTRGLYPMVNPPQFRNNASNALVGSQAVSAGFQLKMQFPTSAGFNSSGASATNAGTFYYTTDGSDPRVYYDTTGQRTPTAVAYVSPITINNTTTVKARTLNGTTWSALMEARFTVGAAISPIRITELHYNPPGGQGGSSAEFIEIQNTGTSSVNIGGWYFDGVDLVIPFGTVIGPGARMVFANNNAPATFAAQFPGVVVTAYFGGSLDNSGERVGLNDATGRSVVAVNYKNAAPWPTTPNGGGYSLEIIDPTGDPNSPFNWKASNAPKGTPGTANSTAGASAVQISEFLVKNTGAYTVGGTTPGYVELFNNSGSPVDLSNWQIVTSQGNSPVFPGGTTIADNGYLVINFTPAALPGLTAPFSLSDQHGRIYLRNATGGVVDGVQYGPQATNFSFGRNGNSWTLSNPTAGAANANAIIGAQTSLRLNEWMANPLPGADDWLELANPGALPVVLTGLHVGTTTELFRITAPAAVAAGGYVQLFCNRGAAAGNNLDFNLPTSGTTLALLDSAAASIDTLTFGAQTENVTQGRLPNATGPVTTLPYPSPAIANHSAITGGPLLNEVLVTNLNGDNAPWAARPGWIELRNSTASPISLTGWSLRIPTQPGASWTFPSGASVASLGYLAVWSDPAQPASSANATHLNCVLTGAVPALSGNGIELVNPAGQIVDRITWGKQIADLSIGRLADNSWALLASPTRGAVNQAAAALGPISAVRINEWYAVGTGVNSDYDYVELYNTSALPVALGGMYLSDDPSEVGRRKYQFPPLTFIAGTGFTTFNADGSATNANFTGFSLDTGGEYLRLGLSDNTQVEAFGFGLQTLGTAQGRQPEGSTTTATFTPTPGVPNATTTGPAITRQPASITTAGGSAAGLSITAVGATSYQWKRNGIDVPNGTSAMLVFDPVTIADDGVYTCVVTGATGTSTSLPATVTVLFTYELWADRYGLAGAERSGAADPENDGLTNYEEFLTNTDPLTSASQSERASVHPVPGLEFSGGAPTFLTMDLRLNRRAAFNELSAEVTSNLPSGWTASAPSATQLLGTEANGDQRLRLKFAIPNGGNQRFLRLTITP